MCDKNCASCENSQYCNDFHLYWCYLHDEYNNENHYCDDFKSSIEYNEPVLSQEFLEEIINEYDEPPYDNELLEDIINGQI